MYDVTWLKGRRSDLHAAIIANALDPKHKDQWFWIEKALLLMGDKSVRNATAAPKPKSAKPAKKAVAAKPAAAPEAESTITLGD